MQKAGVLVAILCGLITGCGSGSGVSGSGSGGGGGTPANIPTLTSIAPSAAPAGASDIVIDVYGSNFVVGSTVNWNGNPLTTNYVSAIELTAVVPAARLVTVKSVAVTVANPLPGGGASGSRPFTINAAPASTTWVKAVPGIAVPWDMVWDEARGRLYLSMATQDSTNPDTIISVDPLAAAVGAAIPAGNNPHLLALSSDSSYLWASLDGDNKVQRFLLPGFAKDVSFSIPISPLGTALTATSLEPAPVKPQTVALAAYGEGGIYVYDDATQRSAFVPGSGPGGGPAINSIVWGKDDSTLYGFGQFGVLYPLAVNASGVSWDGSLSNLLIISRSQYDRNNGLAYSMNVANDPALKTQAGQFDVPVPDTACTADDALGRYYCLTLVEMAGSFSVELWVFDLKTYVLLSRTSFGWGSGSTSTQAHTAITGVPRKLLRWGNAGLALITTSGAEYNVPDPGQPYGFGGLFLIDGAAVNPNAPPDFSSGSSSQSYAFLSSVTPVSAPIGSGDVTLTINGSNFSPDSVAYSNYNNYSGLTLPTTFINSSQLTATLPASALKTAGPLIISVADLASGNLTTGNLAMNSLAFMVSASSGTTQVTAMGLAGLAMAWDAGRNRLYVGTADTDAVYPNSIVALDGTTGAVVQTQKTSPDPDLISLSAGGDYLFVCYAGTTNLAQLALPELNQTTNAVLNNPLGGPWLAGDMKAAPVSPHTAAVTLFTQGSSPRAQGGVAIFDDGVERPIVASGWAQGQTFPAYYDTLAWSASDQLLASAPDSLDGGGPLYALQVNPSGASYLTAGNVVFNTGAGIHSDSGTGLIYSDDGHAADPSTGAIAGSYNASGMVLPDSLLNRVFILGQTSAQTGTQNFTIESFDQKAFTPVSSITLNNLVGSPFAMERWGTSGLAILTVNSNPADWGGPYGMLYLVKDSTFVSNLRPASGQAQAELVQQR